MNQKRPIAATLMGRANAVRAGRTAENEQILAFHIAARGARRAVGSRVDVVAEGELAEKLAGQLETGDFVLVDGLLDNQLRDQLPNSPLGPTSLVRQLVLYADSVQIIQPGSEAAREHGLKDAAPGSAVETPARPVAAVAR